MANKPDRPAAKKGGQQGGSGKMLAIIGAAVVLGGCLCVGVPGGVLGFGWWQLGWFSDSAKKATVQVAKDGKPAQEATPVKDAGGGKAGPTIITKPGEYNLFDGKLVIKIIEENADHRYEIKFVESKMSIGPSPTLKKENTVILLWPVSSRKVWVFWGPHPIKNYALYRLIHHEVTAAPTPRTTQVPPPGIPKEIADALPKNVLESFKGQTS